MKLKTSELTGTALDWAVAKAEGHEIDSLMGGAVWYWLKCSLTGAQEVVEVFNPSTDWAQGGPIIGREIHSITDTTMRSDMNFAWLAKIHVGEGLCVSMYGPTPLIAAMRCYVASKLGDEVDVPDELTMLEGVSK